MISNQINMNESQDTVFLSFSVKPQERERFKLLSKVRNLSASELIVQLINQEFDKQLKPSEIRKLPEDLQSFYWNQQAILAKKILTKHKELNDLPFIADGIE